TIILIDKSTGEEIPFTYAAELERKGAGPPMVNYPTEITLEAGKANLSIPYGTYTVTLKAVKEDYFVIPPELTITIGPGTDRVVISLVPKTYTIAIMVVNDRGDPLPNALVTIRDIKTNLVVASGFTAADGSFQATLKYGNYEVRAAAKGYKESITVVYIPQQSSISVSLEPTPLTIVKRFSPLIVAVIGLSVMLYIISRVRERIAMKLLEEEEYF
ncbi:MAG: carboxypeptidase-like regulatory domain-containing protein, partial [Desulfurococcales archaeon]|nr:carboxypeptidase-like regulatory domain-containing protein [Desulfurococcales archaeon]